MSRSGTQADLRGALERAGNGGAPARQSGKTIKDLLDKMAPEFKRALPKHMDTDRLLRIALTTIRQNPQLMAADQTSLLAALMQCAQLGVEPGILGHAYLVPFRNNRENRTDVQFILGYRGMIDLARRSGQIESIMVEAVHENDEFDYQLGLEPRLYHKPALHDRGKPYLYYGIARFKGGGYQMTVMTLEDIERRRAQSKAANRGPWAEHYEEMCKKTVIRAMWKYLPLSVEVMRAVESSDETIKREIAEDMTEVDAIDVEPTVKGDDDFPPAEDTTGEGAEEGVGA